MLLFQPVGNLIESFMTSVRPENIVDMLTKGADLKTVLLSEGTYCK